MECFFYHYGICTTLLLINHLFSNKNKNKSTMMGSCSWDWQILLWIPQSRICWINIKFYWFIKTQLRKKQLGDKTLKRCSMNASPLWIRNTGFSHLKQINKSADQKINVEVVSPATEKNNSFTHLSLKKSCPCNFPFCWPGHLRS